MRVPSAISRRAFTLIELLVVIAIIAILLTLLFPAVDAAFEQARRTQAKNDAAQIATAITAYYAEYGKLPVDGTGGGGSNINSDKLMNTLAGATENDLLNPREITFLEVPKAKSHKNGAESEGGTYSSAYLDSWQKAYQIYVDDDYDNVIDVPDGLGKVRKTVVVYSKGNPGKTKSYDDPAKWIKSWE